MIDLNNISNFERKVSFSTENSFLKNKELSIVNNIKKISNTTTKFNLLKKIVNGMKRFSTLLMVSKTGRMGIENRKGCIVKYKDEINILKERFHNGIEQQKENSIKLEKKENQLNLLSINVNDLKEILKDNDSFKELINDNEELESIVNNREKLNSLIDNNKELRVKVNIILEDKSKNIESGLENIIEIKNKLIIEEKKIDHFLSLIENENVSIKDRYSFFNYLNELKRAEFFCHQSNNVSDEQFADVFKNIFEERVSRIKSNDIKKIYSEVLDTYKLEKVLLSKKENILENFSTNKEKEKFLSKINFLVSISDSNLNIISHVFDKSELKALHNIMYAILQEEHSDSGIAYSYRDTKDVWIKKYMNEYYGSKNNISKQVVTRSMGTNTDVIIEPIKDSIIDDETSSIHSSGYHAVVSFSGSDLITTINSTIMDDAESVHSSGYHADVSLSDSSLLNQRYFSEIENLQFDFRRESANILKNNLSYSNDIQDSIKNVLSNLYKLSNIVTESLVLPMSENKELNIPLEKMTAFSQIIHSMKEQLESIKPNYSSGLSKQNSFYNKIQASTEDFTKSFEKIANLFDSGIDFSFERNEIDKLLNRLLGDIGYSELIGKKELLDNIMRTIDEFINDLSEGLEWEHENYNIGKNANEIDPDISNEDQLYINDLIEKYDDIDKKKLEIKPSDYMPFSYEELSD